MAIHVLGLLPVTAQKSRDPSIHRSLLFLCSVTYPQPNGPRLPAEFWVLDVQLSLLVHLHRLWVRTYLLSSELFHTSTTSGRNDLSSKKFTRASTHRGMQSRRICGDVKIAC